MNLDDICDCHHLHLISQKIVNWEMIPYGLELDAADVQAIKHDYITYDSQKFYMLCRWKHKKLSDATYRSLHNCFKSNNMDNLAEELYDIMKQPVSPVVSKIMQKYQDKLKRQYKKVPVIGADHWPPRPSDVYINLALIKQQRIKISKIDDEYTKDTIHYGPDDVLNEKEPIELQDIFTFEREEKGNCILIEAGPGLGKTMLSVKICKDWVDGRLLQGYDAVVLLPLRCCKLQRAETVADLFLLENEEFKKELIREIHENEGSRVCLIVEGFDELPFELQKRSIFLNLANELPNSLIIYTSRPVATEQLRRQVVSRRIEIIGFKFEQVLEYVGKTLCDLSKDEQCGEVTGSTKANALIQIINSNPFVQRLIHIPINLAIITYIFHIKESLPLTRTELYSTLVLNIVLRHLRERKPDGTESLEWFDQLPATELTQFYSICELAFEELQSGRVTFSSRHLKVYRIPDNINGLGLLHIAPALSECGTLKSFHFMHLTLQEFCTAFHILRLPKPSQVHVFEKHRDDPKFQVVWQFYAGLSKLCTRQIFTSMIPSSNTFSLLHKSDIVQLLLCLYEANVPDLCEQTIGYMNGIIDLSYYELDLMFCSALACFITNCSPGSIKVLNLGWCGIGDKGLKPISEALIQLYQSDSYAINLQHLEPLDLDVSYNDLTEFGAHHVAKLLSSPCLVGRLVCTGNHKLSDDGVETIVSVAIGNYTIQTLELRWCGIGIKGMQAICELLKSTSSLETLDISYSNLHLKMLTLLTESLAKNCTLTTLKLKWCQLGPDLSEVIDNLLNSSLLNLDLRHNYLGKTGVASIVHALLKRNSKLNSLNLDVNGITDNGVSFLSELITADWSNLSELYVSNNFGEHGIEVVCNNFTKNNSLHTLGIMPCTMSLGEQSSIALSKVLTSTTIKSLHIVPPNNCSALSTAIASNTTLEELKICVKSASHFSALLDGVQQNTSITNLDFLFTRMDEQWLNDLTRMLQVKTNLISLVVNGEVYPEDCVMLCDGLLGCKLLQRLTITPYQRMIPLTVLKFVTALQALDSLEIMTLAVDIHQTQGEGIADRASSTTSQLKLVSKVPKEHVTSFRQLENLMLKINERRQSDSKPALYLHIIDK